VFVDRLRQEIGGVRDELRQLMHNLNTETRTHMLVLHEEELERIKRIGEDEPEQKGPPRRATERRGTVGHLRRTGATIES
jgi:hypothetical protein